MKIYMASSWRNENYFPIKTLLTDNGHCILDWRDEKAGGGFKWSDVTSIPIEEMTSEFYRDTVLEIERVKREYNFVFDYMQEADCCVLLLPCGRSAHLEAGWFVGAGKPLIIHIPVFDGPDLMYKMAHKITINNQELLEILEGLAT